MFNREMQHLEMDDVCLTMFSLTVTGFSTVPIWTQEPGKHMLTPHHLPQSKATAMLGNHHWSTKSMWFLSSKPGQVIRAALIMQQNWKPVDKMAKVAIYHHPQYLTEDRISVPYFSTWAWYYSQKLEAWGTAHVKHIFVSVVLGEHCLYSAFIVYINWLPAFCFKSQL